MKVMAFMLAAWGLALNAWAGAAAPEVALAEPAFSVANGKPELSAKVVVTRGDLLGADFQRFGITSWKDDKGTDLGSKDPNTFYGNVVPMTTRSGADTLLVLSGMKAPEAGATSMSIEGTLPFHVGTDLREGVSKGVKLAAGTAFDVGPYTFKIARIEPTRELFGFERADGLLVHFTFNSPVQLKEASFLKEFTFLDATGKEQASRKKNFMGSFKDGGEHRLSWAVLPAQGPLDVRWAIYGKIVSVSVPLKHSGPIRAKQEKAP